MLHVPSHGPSIYASPKHYPSWFLLIIVLMDSGARESQPQQLSRQASSPLPGGASANLPLLRLPRSPAYSPSLEGKLFNLSGEELGCFKGGKMWFSAAFFDILLPRYRTRNFRAAVTKYGLKIGVVDTVAERFEQAYKSALVNHEKKRVKTQKTLQELEQKIDDEKRADCRADLLLSLHEEASQHRASLKSYDELQEIPVEYEEKTQIVAVLLIPGIPTLLKWLQVPVVWCPIVVMTAETIEVQKQTRMMPLVASASVEVPKLEPPSRPAPTAPKTPVLPSRSERHRTNSEPDPGSDSTPDQGSDWTPDPALAAPRGRDHPFAFGIPPRQNGEREHQTPLDADKAEGQERNNVYRTYSQPPTQAELAAMSPPKQERVLSPLFQKVEGKALQRSGSAPSLTPRLKEEDPGDSRPGDMPVRHFFPVTNPNQTSSLRPPGSGRKVMPVDSEGNPVQAPAPSSSSKKIFPLFEPLAPAAAPAGYGGRRVVPLTPELEARRFDGSPMSGSPLFGPSRSPGQTQTDGPFAKHSCSLGNSASRHHAINTRHHLMKHSCRCKGLNMCVIGCRGCPCLQGFCRLAQARSQTGSQVGLDGSRSTDTSRTPDSLSEVGELVVEDLPGI
eukprot:g73026.t1